MAVLLEDLRRDVVGCAADCLLDLTFGLDPGRQPKIADLGLHLIIDQDIAQFEIPMNDALLMNINQRLDHLADIHPGLMFDQPFPPLDQILKCVVPAILQQDINILLVLESVNKLNDVFVFESFVDFNFDEEFVALALFVDGFLGDDLGGKQAGGLLVDRFVGFGETAGAEQFA